MSKEHDEVIEAAIAWRLVLRNIDKGKATGKQAFEAAERLRLAVDAYLRTLPA